MGFDWEVFGVVLLNLLLLLSEDLLFIFFSVPFFKRKEPKNLSAQSLRVSGRALRERQCMDFREGF